MKTANTHTQGPWQTAGKSVYTPSKWKDGRDSGQVLIASCFSEGDRDTVDCGFLGAAKVVSSDEEANANADLIAAAPEIWAALTWCREVLSAYLAADSQEARDYYRKDLEHAENTARNAIAKAKGQS